jgi:tetratricopeptide (TPR) repeat protein
VVVQSCTRAGKHGRHSNAASDCSRISPPPTVHNTLKLAYLYIDVEEYGKARVVLEGIGARELDASRRGAEAQWFGIVDARRQDFRSAIRHFTAAVKREPNALSIRANLAEAYLKDGQVEAAEAEYKRILEDAPSHVEAHIGLGEVSYHDGRRRR